MQQYLVKVVVRIIRDAKVQSVGLQAVLVEAMQEPSEHCKSQKARRLFLSDSLKQKSLKARAGYLRLRPLLP